MTNIGAREYDPTIGAFISVDLVLETGDPRQINGYTYSADNPTNNADPTGLTICDITGTCGTQSGVETPNIKHDETTGGCSTSTPGCPGYSDGSSALGALGAGALLGLAKLNSPSFSNPPAGTPPSTVTAAAAGQYLEALQAVNQYYGRKGWVAYKNSTVIISSITVQTPTGPAPRIVAFVSKAGADPELESELTDLGVTIYMATTTVDNPKGHAEGAAAALRLNEPEQEASLGGTIANVGDTVLTTSICVIPFEQYILAANELGEVNPGFVRVDINKEIGEDEPLAQILRKLQKLPEVVENLAANGAAIDTEGIRARAFS